MIFASAPPLRGVVSELVFAQNYACSLWAHTWSLAVEEHFYIFLAAGLFVLARRRTGRPFAAIPGIFLAVALVCLGLRVLAGARAPHAYKTHLFPTHLRLDGLLFGVVIAYLLHTQPARFLAAAARYRYFFLGAALILLAPAFCLPLGVTSFPSTYGLTLFYVGSGSLLVAALGLPAPASFLGSALAYVGSHSYSVYLWHVPVIRWLIPGAKSLFGAHFGWPAYAFLYLGGSVALGVVMALLVELPVLRIRDRLFPSRGGRLCVDEKGISC